MMENIGHKIFVVYEKFVSAKNQGYELSDCGHLQYKKLYWREQER